MIGFIDDPPSSYRSPPFSHTVRALRGFLVGDEIRRAGSKVMAVGARHHVSHRGAAAGARQPCLFRALLRRTARVDLRARPYGRRQVRAGDCEIMTPQAGRTDRKFSNAAWLTSGALPRLLTVLDCEGEEARAVGGAVRNALLGVPVLEVDVATTAVPDEVVKRVTAAGFKAVPTGIEHGTVTVVIDGAPFEVTTLRQDVETYGRHAKVAFGRDWKADAERRDFTMNALSATRDGAVHDYTGGLADLEARRVRFIGEAKQRIAEDYLRVLRFFRFHAAYGEGPLDKDGLHACIMARNDLAQLSRERVRTEIMKLLVARGASGVLQAMADC